MSAQGNARPRGASGAGRKANVLVGDAENNTTRRPAVYQTKNTATNWAWRVRGISGTEKLVPFRAKKGGTP